MLNNNEGFTFLELVVALVMLGSVALGLNSLTGRMARTASQAEVRALAAQAAHGRISEILMDPRYGSLDSLYVESDVELDNLPGFTRSTTITTVQAADGDVQYKRVAVVVDGPPLGSPIRRSAEVGTP